MKMFEPHHLCFRAITLCFVLTNVFSASEVANYPVITDMKSGEHKLLLSTQSGYYKLSKSQSYRSASFQVKFKEIPYVALGLLVFEANHSTDSVNYSVEISSISKTFFETNLTIENGTSLNQLRYMYIAFEKNAIYGQIYFVSVSPQNFNHSVQTIRNENHTYNPAHTNLFIPILASFSLIAQNQDFSVKVEVSNYTQTNYTSVLMSNCSLQKANFFVIHVDKTVLENTSLYYFDYGFTYGENSDNGVTLLDLPASSFNYYNYISGMNWLAFSSDQQILSLNFNGNPILTLGTYKYARANLLHWRKRQCLKYPYYLHSFSKCYDNCPSRYADDPDLGICQKCDYTCLSCESDGLTCITCSDVSQVHRVLRNNSSCKCQDGFFDDGVNETCRACHYTCKTCFANAYNCSSCPHNRYNTSNNSCECPVRTFDPLTNASLCQKCHYTCLTCEISANRCTSCNKAANRSLVQGNRCLCKSGFEAVSDSSQNCSENKNLDCTSPCLTCQNTSSTCTSCHQDLNRVYSQSQSTCSCTSGYESVNNALNCTQICGDDIVYQDQCDDGNRINGDGCSSTCTIEPNYECDTSTSPTRCVYKLGYEIDVNSIKKDPDANKLYLTFQIIPAAPAGSVPQLILSNGSVSSAPSEDQTSKLNLETIEFKFEGTTLTMEISYSESIPEFTKAILSINGVGKSNSFDMKADDSSAINYYDPSEYSLSSSQNAMLWVLIGVMWVGAIILIVLDRDSILMVCELFIASGMVWIGLIGLHRYVLFFEPLLNLRYLFGYNQYPSGDRSSSFQDGLLAYVNYGLILNFLPLIIFGFLFLINKIRPTLYEMKQSTKTFVLYQLSYCFLCFNSIMVVFGLSTQAITRTFETAISIGSLFVGIMYLLLLLLSSVAMIRKSLFFPSFRSGLKDKGPIFFVLVLSMKLVGALVYLIVGYQSVDLRLYTPLILGGFSLGIMIILVLAQPYRYTIWAISNESCQFLSYLGCFLIKQIESAEWVGFAILILIYLMVFVNYLIMSRAAYLKHQQSGQSDQEKEQEDTDYYGDRIEDNEMSLYYNPQQEIGQGDVGAFKFINPKLDRPEPLALRPDEMVRQNLRDP